MLCSSYLPLGVSQHAYHLGTSPAAVHLRRLKNLARRCRTHRVSAPCRRTLHSRGLQQAGVEVSPRRPLDFQGRLARLKLAPPAPLLLFLHRPHNRRYVPYELLVSSSCLVRRISYADLGIAQLGNAAIRITQMMNVPNWEMQNWRQCCNVESSIPNWVCLLLNHN